MKKSASYFLSLIILLSVATIGCDVSAERELRRAQASLDIADEMDAEAYAAEDYMAAEELFEEAMAASEDDQVQEARRLAIKAKLRAEDAIDKTKDRLRSLEAEQERLGR